MADHIYIFAASSAQRSLWLLDQLAPGSARYNLYTATRFPSALNTGALQRSIDEIVRRHESLRTAFKEVDGEPIQAVAAELAVELRVIDLTAAPEEEREDMAYRMVAEETQQPFDLAAWPLFHAHLIRMGQQDHIFLLVIHHIVCDFWSVEILEKELNILYGAFCADRPSPLPELPIQYGDYAEWQSRWLHGPEAAAHLAYWRKQLADLPVLQLPSDWARPLDPSFAGAQHGFWLAEPVYRALLGLSQAENITLFMTALAGLQILLHRYSGQSDFAVGTPIANRNRAEVEDLIGFFVNSLVLRADLSGNPTVRDLLSRVRETALDAYAHQDLPFEELVRELKPERGLGQNPLFQVHFQLLRDIGSSQTPAALAGDVYEIEGITAKFDLALDFWEYPDGLWVHVEYSTDLFTEETIARMEGHFRAIFEAMTADPLRRVGELPILSEEERRQILVDWNNTEVNYARDKCLHQLFEEQVERTPRAVALVFGQKELTYTELNDRSNKLAHHLISLGVGPESIIALCVERSIEMIVGLLGILKAGAAYLPLDPAYPTWRLAFMLEDAQPRLLLTQRAVSRALPSNGLRFLFLDDDAKWKSASPENPVTAVTSTNLAYVIYTSGSTGNPKGVLVHSQAVCNHLLWMQAAFPLSGADSTLLKYPFNFDASVCEIFCPLIAGATLVIADPSEHWDISEFIRLLEENRITALDVVPSMLEALVQEDAFSTCSSLKRITSGGESFPAELRDRFFAQSEAALHNIYGPTEATIGASSWTCLPGAIDEVVPIGAPIANTQLYILDSYLNPVPIGVAGELCIGGDGIARGYLNRPDLTAERFIPDPFAARPGARLYRSGDCARQWSDGNIEYLGRLDQQIKLRGYRIELGEIESALTQHPSVRGCAVMLLKEADHARLVAYLTAVPEAAELWPSVGEYDVYDELLYYAMTHDETRNQAYRAAIDASVTQKIVLDIGTGADAVLTRFCIEAGAQHVYAIEIGDDAFNHARRVIDSLELSGKVTLIHGDSTQMQLPEKVDVCVSEILGAIGSSEGVGPILNDARRFLKEGGVMIPRRCVTRIAAVSLPPELKHRPKFSDLPGAYVARVFEKTGYSFDLRLCVKNFPASDVVSSEAVFEDLDFTGEVGLQNGQDITLTITKSCTLQGFLLWLNLYPSNEQVIDSLNSRTSWLPVFWPAFYPGIDVLQGDVIHAKCSSTAGAAGRMPEYAIEGILRRRSNEPIAFRYDSRHHGGGFRRNPFYKALFDDYDPAGQLEVINGPGAHTGHDPLAAEKTYRLIPELRKYLRGRLPEYMIPASFVILDELPATSSGKLDRAALALFGQSAAARTQPYVAPRNEKEAVLATIWAELLGVDRVGIHDNFFDLGGDSILSIQIVARATQAGLHLRPAQLFRHQTIAEIAAEAESAPALPAEEEMLTGSVPLTPVQQWFFEQELIDRHHYNQSMLIEAPHPVDAMKLNLALNEVIKHHDALRIRFTHEGSNWQQTFVDDGSITLVHLDLSALPKDQREGVFSRWTFELQASLNVSAGPMIRAALIDTVSHGSYLFLVIHHLLVDGVSWRILLEDLWTAYEQLSNGTEVQLPPQTTSFQLWARRLTEYAHSTELEGDASYWLRFPWDQISAIPRDFQGGANTGTSTRSVAVALEAEETRALLQEVPKAYRTQINDVLLTALLEALAEWSGAKSILIDLEGHGREAIIPDVDLSRTIGWFTTIFPVYLQRGTETRPGDVLKSVKEQLRRIPNRGISYGLLRYVSRNEHLREMLRNLPRPEVAFNYLGQYAPTYAEDGYRSRLSELTGANVSPRDSRAYLLEIDGSVIEGRLEMIWTYNESIHRRSTIKELAAAFAGELRTLIDHCKMPATGGYTPSDFSRAKLTQKELDRLISKLR